MILRLHRLSYNTEVFVNTETLLHIDRWAGMNSRLSMVDDRQLYIEESPEYITYLVQSANVRPLSV